MIPCRTFIVLSLMLLLVSCQSAGDDDLLSGKSKPSVTAQHLERDKTIDHKETAGIFSVVLLPVPLTSADQAVAVLRNCQDENGFEWEVDGNLLPGEVSKSLSNSYFQRGDSVKIIAYCGSQERENITVVQNSPPAITAVEFQSPELISGHDLTVRPVAEDLDGDFIGFNYEWVVDGLLIDDINEATLPGYLLKKGTQVALAVTPYDNHSDGMTFQGLSFYIPNTAPIIKSQPPPLLSEQYMYRVEAVDPDNDELKYQLTQGPPGMEINENTGVLTWSIDQNTLIGSYDIEIIVEDPDGFQAIQFYVLSLSESESVK